ncbi:hypothetical protein ACE6H2_011892 [Prunus campanulata]
MPNLYGNYYGLRLLTSSMHLSNTSRCYWFLFKIIKNLRELAATCLFDSFLRVDKAMFMSYWLLFKIFKNLQELAAKRSFDCFLRVGKAMFRSLGVKLRELGA